MISLRTEVVDLTGELATLQRSRDDLRRRLDENRRRAGELVSYLTSSKARVESEAQLVSDLATRLEKESARRSEHEKQIFHLDSRMATARAALEKELAAEKNVGARLSALRARKKLLEDLERAFEGYGKGPRSVLEAASQGRLGGVAGSVSQLLSCEAKYIPALSAAIGGAAEHLVVEDEEAAKAAITMLKKVKGGRATFLPLSLIRPRQMHPRAREAVSKMKGVRPLLSVLSYPDRLESAPVPVRRIASPTTWSALAFAPAGHLVVTLSTKDRTGRAMTGRGSRQALFRRKPIS